MLLQTPCIRSDGCFHVNGTTVISWLTLHGQAVQTDRYEADDLFPTGRRLRGAQADMACVRLLPGENDLTL